MAGPQVDPTAPLQISLCGRDLGGASPLPPTPGGSLITNLVMKAARAWVAQLGQRRSVEVAVPKGFAGSNPAPRILRLNPRATMVGVPPRPPRSEIARAPKALPD